MEPATIWQPTGGEGEYSSTGNPNLGTESGVDLLTESNANLIEEDSSFSGTPVTTWSSADGT